MSLNAKQRSQLKSLAHHLKPIHHIGKEGLTDASIQSISDAFNQRELLKVRVQESAPETAREAGQLLSERIPGVEHIQTIGRVVVLYRRHPKKPEIVLDGT
jgi:RNA-binding protein